MILQNYNNLSFTVNNYVEFYSTNYNSLELSFNSDMLYKQKDLEEVYFINNKFYIFANCLTSYKITYGSKNTYKLNYANCEIISEEEYKLKLRLEKLSAFS